MTGADGARDPRGEPSAARWERIWAEQGRQDVSWYEETPATSTELVLLDGVPEKVIDVGAGSSSLPEALLDAGVSDLTLLDLSMSALTLTSVRLEQHGARATTIVGDVLTHVFDEQYDVWHDRAVFHFLVEAEQRSAYVAQAARAVRPGGLLVVGAFAEDGPEQCSGLPVARYSVDELSATLADGFVPVTSRRAEHHTPWNSVQPFSWVVLRRA